ncbi:toxin Cry1Ac domain D-VI-related protein [Metalysinibacillus jejuensis]|uniref:toxin Cry1Ac domain D-VI-related protein n=1 Tax=Metalysinibacillus jejuensis TaxID=914327 RepID=UPI00129079E0|nr:toxin Cry1Ac domain D-VI-related protein [Metalysinibacillus jejuensis]
MQEIQAYFVVGNFNALITDAVTLGATAASTVVDDLKLYEALEYGVEAGLLTDVNFDKYFTTYVATIKGFATADATKLTATGIQTNVIDTAVQATVTNAENAVIALTAAKLPADITAAEALVAVVDETSVYADNKGNLNVAGVSIEVKGQNVKEALTAIVEDIKAAKIVYTVITASNPINQAKLNTALQEAGVNRAYEDYIVEYATALAGLTTTADSLTEIQGFIDNVNDTKATALVAAAVADLTPENVAAAEEAINRLAPDVEGSRTKVADLTAQLEAAGTATANLAAATAAVEALTNAAGDALAEGVGQDEIDAASVLVEALPADVSPATDKADLQALVEAAQALQDVVNLAAATAAVEALTNAAGDALAEGVGQDEIDAASVLVEALPADVSPATDKADLQAAVEAAQELLDVKLINDAIANEDVATLQEIIVGIGSTTFGNLSKAQRAELGEYIINKAHSEEPVTTYTATADFKSAIDTASTGFVATYVADIAAFNTATNATIASTGATKAQKDAVVAAIKKVTTLEGFTAVTELDLAEAILDAKPEAGYNVKTIAEIKALVEANK